MVADPGYRDLCSANAAVCELRAQLQRAEARHWDDAVVAEIIAERDALRVALDGLVRHTLPHATPEILRRLDPPWQRAGAVLWSRA